MMKTLILFALAAMTILNNSAQAQTTVFKPVKIAVIGLVHGHVGWILGRPKSTDVEMIAIVEKDTALARKLSKQFGFPLSIVYSTAQEMLRHHKPEAVVTFTNTYDHLQTVQTFAPLGIHVMVEKPLAVSVDHAKKMIALAKQHNIKLITNYETTWYGSNREARKIVNDEQAIGALTKIVFHTGHEGPKEIGCGPEFLQWLTDPKLNGAGALMDFGCYGANIATWLLNGQKPLSITALTQQIKPDVYPKVDDEATIVVEYPKTQVIIQASWNWPFSRKDMELYGKTGYVTCLDGSNMQVRLSGAKKAEPIKASPLPTGESDPFAYFAGIVRGTIKPAEVFDLSATENNLMVVQILEAAKQSAATGQKVVWKEMFGDK